MRTRPSNDAGYINLTCLLNRLNMPLFRSWSYLRYAHYFFELFGCHRIALGHGVNRYG
jgi:hypothetical protein